MTLQNGKANTETERRGGWKNLGKLKRRVQGPDGRIHHISNRADAMIWWIINNDDLLDEFEEARIEFHFAGSSMHVKFIPVMGWKMKIPK